MARPVTLGMVTVQSRNEPMAERRRWLSAQVDAAGARGCQIVALPEFSDHHVTADAGAARQQSVDAYRRVVGLTPESPWMRELADLARKHKMVVIPNVLRRDGERHVNSAMVIGPEGDVLGEYRKTHLAPEEKKTVEPGDDIAPIATPFGKIGLLICYDINFPEITRCHELQGAEILIWTTMRQVETEEALYRAVLPARAFDHRMPLAVATYCTRLQRVSRAPMSSAIFNAFGQPVAGGQTTPGLLIGTVDLEQRPLMRRKWGDPEWLDATSYLCRQRRPELYGAITAPLTGEAADPDAEPKAGDYPEMVKPVM